MYSSCLNVNMILGNHDSTVTFKHDTLFLFVRDHVIIFNQKTENPPRP